MPAEITMPQQSDTMTEGTLVKWLMKEGDKYAEGDIVAEIETDKATMEMEGPDQPGTIAAVLVKEGEKVPVGRVLAVVALEGEDVEEVRQQASSGSKGKAQAKQSAGGEKTAEADKPTATATKERPPGESAGQAGDGKRRDDQPDESDEPAQPDRPRQQDGQVRRTVAGDYGGPQRLAMEMPAAEGNGHAPDRVKASPVARRVAREKGIDLAQVQGSGPGGRVVHKDILEFDPSSARRPAPERREAAEAAPRAAQPQRPAPALPKRVPSGKQEVVELSKMRLAIGQRLQQSKQNIPHFYETVDIELDAAEALRGRLNAMLEAEGVRISIGDLIARAVASTLKLHPVLNSTFDGQKLTRHGDVNLGMAVALDEGLIVPVLRNIDQMGFREIRIRSKDLADRARAGKLRGEEMSGATFTVSNLGMFGVREFSAIINPPEVGILAIGAGEPRPVVRDGQIVTRTMMSVTLSADHRAVDGADSARFLATLRQMLEEPGIMLV